MTNQALAVLPLCLALTACEAQRSAGQCIGLNDDPVKGVRYEYSARNIILGIGFVEMIVPPVLVVLKELKCPVLLPSDGTPGGQR